ncbi:MAG: carboxypeptidase-like regulatory domain-containing protein [Acidobacteriota bacterium]
MTRATDSQPIDAAGRSARGGLVLRLLTAGLVALCSPLVAEPADLSQPDPLQADRAETPLVAGAVNGRVLAGDGPAEEAKVFAYDVTSYEIVEATAEDDGTFLFRRLPAGMYKLVAHQSGFLPSVELLLRRTAEATQEVEFRLRREEVGDVRTAEDYWSVRGRVPPDVMRQINRESFEPATPIGIELTDSEIFEARMQALSGIEDVGELATAVTTAAFDVRGAVGDTRVGVGAEIQQLAPRGESEIDGATRAMALKLAGADTTDHRLLLTTARGELSPIDQDEVGLESYRVDWQKSQDQRGEARVTASYIEESNFHRSGALDPMAVPVASETWQVEGSYRRELSQNHGLSTGLHYRQRQTDGPLATPVEDRLGLFGLADSRIQPRVLVEYGLYATVRDGSLSLMPHGGLVVELGDGWNARAAASQRVEQEDSGLLPTSFHTAFYNDRTSCREVGEACYEVSLTRERDKQEDVRLGAIHREFSETLRLTFSRDFFDRLDNVVMVAGDSLPEVQFSAVRRISPKVLARLEANFASGGGGVFYATDSNAYENEVRYLVTSLDTHFESTATGVFVAFHHLEQVFRPVESTQPSIDRNDTQRLQLMLTQDLSALVDMATRWAVRLDMEVSRGTSPYTLTIDDELRKKLTGGFSVSF